MIRTLLLLLLVGGCIDENKTDCSNDGDCRGVRVCRDGECVTPDDFQNNGLPPRDTGAGDVGLTDAQSDGGRPIADVAVDASQADAGGASIDAGSGNAVDLGD